MWLKREEVIKERERKRQKRKKGKVSATKCCDFVSAYELRRILAF